MFLLARMRKRLEAALAALDHLMALVCYALLCVIIVITLVQIFLRFVLRNPISWSEEVALLLLVWFGMIAIAIAVHRHGHLAIMAVRDRLPFPFNSFLDILAQLLIAGFGLVQFICGFDLVALAGGQTLPASDIGKTWFYYPVIIGGALLTINALGNILTGRWTPVSESAGH